MTIGFSSGLTGVVTMAWSGIPWIGSSMPAIFATTAFIPPQAWMTWPARTVPRLV